MKTNGWQVKKNNKQKQEKRSFCKNIKSSQKLPWRWMEKKRGDYGKHMQDVTYFCGFSGVGITLLHIL